MFNCNFTLRFNNDIISEKLTQNYVDTGGKKDAYM